MKIQYISSCWTHLDVSAFDGSFEDIISNLGKIKSNILRDHSDAFNIRILAEQWYDNVEIAVYYDRPENEKEIAARKAKEARERKKKVEASSKKEEQDRKEYERLKKKFG